MVAGAILFETDCNVGCVGDVAHGDRPHTGDTLGEAETLRWPQQPEPMRVIGALTQVNRLLGRARAKPGIALRFVGSVIHRFFPSLVVLPVNAPVFTWVQLLVVGAPMSGPGVDRFEHAVRL
jgi:hypothetical protein